MATISPIQQLTPEQQALCDRVRAFALEGHESRRAKWKTESLSYFASVSLNGATMEERGKTRRESRCTICRDWQDKGARKFMVRIPLAAGNEYMSYVHPCPTCLDELLTAVNYTTQPVEMEVVTN